jgi:hypothetical protein
LVDRESVERTVSRFTYKPGCRFVVGQRYEGIDISLHAKVPDALNPKTVIPVHIWRTLDRWQCLRFTDAEVKFTVQSLVREFELHEIDEWLKFDGEHVRDPHPELGGSDGKEEKQEESAQRGA